MQRAFDFPTLDTVTLRWKLGWLTVRWGTGIKGYFRSWEAALSCVLHPLNDNIRVIRIRS